LIRKYDQKEFEAISDLFSAFTLLLFHFTFGTSSEKPSGGVVEGEIIHVPYQPNENVRNFEGTSLLPTVLIGPSEPAPHPYGRWKDGLCDCCIYGCCNISCCNALCFPRILMAQILTRLKMDIFANPAGGDAWQKTFRRMWILVIAFFVARAVLSCSNPQFENVDGNVNVVEPDCPAWQRSLNFILSMSFGLYTIIVLTKMRKAVRSRYKIPTERQCCVCCCGPLEDFCCSFWCSCCTIAQLARQTADYDRNRAACCTKDGMRHPNTVPAVVV
jgi:Cys-rich protein (TIGR01571 family)